MAKKTMKLILVLAPIYLVSIALRVAYPSKTETELFLSFWWVWLALGGVTCWAALTISKEPKP